MNNAQGQTAGFADNADANQMYHLAERVAKLEGAVPHSATKADINQLREEITALRGEVKNNFTKVNARIDSIEKRLDRVEERLDRLEARFDQLEKHMDKRLDRQLYITLAGFVVLFVKDNPHVAELATQFIGVFLR